MKYAFLFLLSLFFTSCNTTIEKKYSKIIGKTIVLPEDAKFTIWGEQQVDPPNSSGYKIVSYIDSLDCLSCHLNLYLWKDLLTKMNAYNIDPPALLIYINSKNIKDVSFVLKKNNFDYPVCIDLEDNFNRINHFPDDNRFRCFLLDENNRVVLIGNPVNNPKIKELYIRTICERLGIESPTSNEGSQRLEKSLGVFDWHVEQQTSFVINNQNDDIMHIDSLYTSCECTTASIDLTDIEPRGKAIVNVIFKADKIEQFMREIYADIRGGKQIIMTINGEATE